MSARQKFHPQTRPPSVQQTPESTDLQAHHVQQSVQETFRPNGLLSDPGLKSTNRPSPSQGTSPEGNEQPSEPLSMTGVDKPLNISSFAKSKLNHARGSFEGRSSHAGSTHFAQPSLHMASTSSAFTPTGSALSPMPFFRAYNHPTTGDEFKAHMQTTRSGFDEHVTQKSSLSSSPKPFAPLRFPSLDQMEDPQDNAANVRHPGLEATRHREGSGEDLLHHSEARTQFYNSVQKPPLRGSQKRIERMDDELAVKHSPLKRQKVDDEVSLYATHLVSN